MREKSTTLALRRQRSQIRILSGAPGFPGLCAKRRGPIALCVQLHNYPSIAEGDYAAVPNRSITSASGICSSIAPERLRRLSVFQCDGALHCRYPRRVDYDLTPAGRQFRAMIDGLANWWETSAGLRADATPLARAA